MTEKLLKVEPISMEEEIATLKLQVVRLESVIARMVDDAHGHSYDDINETFSKDTSDNPIRVMAQDLIEGKEALTEVEYENQAGINRKITHELIMGINRS